MMAGLMQSSTNPDVDPPHIIEGINYQNQNLKKKDFQSYKKQKKMQKFFKKLFFYSKLKLKNKPIFIFLEKIQVFKRFEILFLKIYFDSNTELNNKFNSNFKIFFYNFGEGFFSSISF
jgi:hypothetical protein